MKKRVFAIFALAVLMLSIFAGCSSSDSKLLTDEEAQQIALDDAGFNKSAVTDLHTHFGIVDHVPQYQIHFTHGTTEYEYVINAVTGEIISSKK